MMMEITAAKMGRLMKKLEIFMVALGLFPRLRLARFLFVTQKGGLRGCPARRADLTRHGDFLGIDDGSGPHALQAVYDDDVGRCAKPSRTTRIPLSSGRVFTGRYSSVLFLPSTKTYFDSSP